MENQKLKALVCGASKGIGRAIALGLSKKNYAVTALARDTEALNSLQAEMGSGNETVSLDFSRSQQVHEFLGSHEMNYDVLVCNSGGPSSGPLVEASVQDFQGAFEQHLYFNHRLVQAALPAMKAKQFGRIITILSTSVKAPLPNLGVSNTLRAAVAAWAKTLSLELGPFGITVNNVLPGYTQTDRLDALISSAATKSKKDTEAVIKDWEDKVPLKRFAEASELANAVCFLASREASYISGINLPVDGGRLSSL